MKYRKKLIICALLAGLTILTNSCRPKKEPQLEFISTKIFTDFPSASAIEYSNGKLYVFGDDAPYLLILDTAYNRVDTVHYVTDTAYRIDKTGKPDIESATLISYNDEKHLYALGSFSADNRMNLFYFPLADVHSFLTIDYSPFAQKLKTLPELNIEGLAFVKSKLVMSNRANKTNTINKLILGDNNLHEYKTGSPLTIIDLIIDSTNVIGISGLYYLEEKDLLLFTASEEDTPNAIEDGTINDSYLGWIENFSRKMEAKTIKPLHIIKLSTINKAFIKQKIESICVERINDNEMILHLVADNDNGESRLFKMKLIL